MGNRCYVNAECGCRSTCGTLRSASPRSCGRNGSNLYWDVSKVVKQAPKKCYSIVSIAGKLITRRFSVFPGRRAVAAKNLGLGELCGRLAPLRSNEINPFATSANPVRALSSAKGRTASGALAGFQQRLIDS